jgi:abhydrolase domain-containing protein 12
VTPFALRTPDSETIRAWHLLPLTIYYRNQAALCKQQSGFVADIESTLNLKLLRNDPEALLVVYLHGAGETLGSGFRPPSYRAISAAAPDKIHIVAVDYRGFGDSTCKPSKEGLLTDALLITDWATNTAKIPASRIVLFA